MQSNPNSPFISVLGLGRLKSEHPTPKGKWASLVFGILVMLAAPIFVLLALFLGYDAYSRHGLAQVGDAVIIPLIVAGIAFIVGALILWEAWRTWPLAAALYEEGFALNSRKGLQQVRWDQIAAIWQSVTKHYYNGVYTGTTHIYTIHTKDKVKIVLNDKLSKVEDLGRAVQLGVSNALFPNYVRALQSGQRLTFGPLALDAAKLYSGSKEVAWGDIKAIKINQGIISIKKEKGWFNWASVTVPQIPNFFIFLEIVSRLTKVE
jgi:hypothetical protein